MNDGSRPGSCLYSWNGDCLELTRIKVGQSGHDLNDGCLVFRIVQAALLRWLKALPDYPVLVPVEFNLGAFEGFELLYE